VTAPARRRLALTAATTVVVALVAGCTSSAPLAPVARKPVPPFTWVVLGGDATVDDRRPVPLGATWPQVAFADHLPPGAVELNLGRPGADLAAVGRDQVAAAIELDADLVTLWLADADPGTSQEVLDDILLRLTGSGAEVVVVLGGATAVGGRANLGDLGAMRDVTVVAIPDPDLSTPAGHARVAELLGPALRAASAGP